MITQHAPLKSLTSWKVGGCAELLFQPTDSEELSHFLAQQPAQTPITWLGLGSNLLVRDGGIKGVVIATLPGLKQLQQLPSGVIRAEAGVSCAKFARFCANQDGKGTEFLATVPGTVGGALKMNAGAFGGETWEFVQAVETINRQGQIMLRDASEFSVAYRHVVLPEDEWFIAGHFKLASGDKEQSVAKIKQIIAKRAAAQPTGLPCCGSVFRNPPGDHAARLIDSCGLKGFAIGDAYISEKHANFIINRGDASSADIEKLIDTIKQQVLATHKIELQPEVHVIGDALTDQ